MFLLCIKLNGTKVDERQATILSSCIISAHSTSSTTYTIFEEMSVFPAVYKKVQKAKKSQP